MRATLALVIGALLVLQGILGIAAPDLFLKTLRFIQTPPVIYLAAVVRVAFGVVLLRAAPVSRAPTFLRVFGLLIVIGGLLTPFLGVWAAHVILDWWSEAGTCTCPRLRRSIPGARRLGYLCGCSQPLQLFNSVIIFTNSRTTGERAPRVRYPDH